MTTETPSPRLAWSRALVYGLGASGRAAARLLLGRGVRVVGVDSRSAGELDLAGLEGELEVRRDDELRELPVDVDAVVISPGVPPDRPLLAQARASGVPILAEVELAYHHLDGPVVAITGSNGKSTTTALTGAMLREAGFDAAVCGNIGTPLSEAVMETAEHGGADGEEGVAERLYVVEMSSFQLESIGRFRARAAAFLNLAPDHLDRHGDVESYTEAKRRIFRNQTADDVAVLNADDPRSRETGTRSRRRLFSLRDAVEDGCFLVRSKEGDRVVERGGDGGESELFRASDSSLPGEHNLANAMAAALLARAMGASADDCRRALRSFRGLAHRTERVAEAGGVTWYDDSKGTNPAATLGCLRGFGDGTVHLILGGSDKGSDFRELTAAVAAKARRVYLIGETAEAIEAALTGEGGAAVPVVRAGTLDRAVAEAAEAARPGEVVLLSPACASFDQFDDFNHRGDEFQRLVGERIAATAGAGAAPVGEGADG